MMDKFEFGDFYRFCVSLGLAMMLLALLIPWMLVKETSWVDATSPGRAVPAERQKIAEAEALYRPTPLERDRGAAAARRAQIVRFAYEWIGWPTGLFAIMGLAFFSYGVWNWRTRQVKRDEKENAEIDQVLDKAAPKATAASLERKAELEAAQNEQEEAEKRGAMSSKTGRASGGASATGDSKRKEIEDRVLALIETDAASFLVRRERQLGRTVADAIMISVGPDQMDVVVEVKWIRRGFRTGWFIEVVQRVSAMVDLYSAKSNRRSRGLVIIVVSDSAVEAINGLFADPMLQDALRGPVSGMGVAIINESAVDNGIVRGGELLQRSEGVWLKFASP